jgi:hypothetical protein
LLGTAKRFWTVGAAFTGQKHTVFRVSMKQQHLTAHVTQAPLELKDYSSSLFSNRAFHFVLASSS